MANAMALKFPNSSRNYDAGKHCIRFKGYDTVFEVAFELDSAAIRRLSPVVGEDEGALLGAFDLNRERIERVAGRAYSKRRGDFIRLSASDF